MLFRSDLSTRIILFLLLLSGTYSVNAQDSTATDTVKRIEIIRADNLRQITTDSGIVLNALTGNAMVRHENTLLSGDSIVFDPDSGYAEVFGKVHINDGDTVQTESDYLRYVGKERKAYLTGKVRLTDRKGTVVSEVLTYDVASGMATYEGGGRVENGTTLLTSRSALYFSGGD